MITKYDGPEREPEDILVISGSVDDIERAMGPVKIVGEVTRSITQNIGSLSGYIEGGPEDMAYKIVNDRMDIDGVCGFRHHQTTVYAEIGGASTVQITFTGMGVKKLDKGEIDANTIVIGSDEMECPECGSCLEAEARKCYLCDTQFRRKQA